VPDPVEQRVEAVLGRRPVRLTPVGRGYTQAQRLLVELEGGARAFVKLAVDGLTAGWLRDERRIYANVHGSFLPELLGFDAGELPGLALEDLSSARWPPPWSEGSVEAVVRALDELHRIEPPPGVPSILEFERLFEAWNVVELDPQPFLSLELCSAAWLEANLALLRQAAENAPFAGETLIHLDVRSDNICLRDDRALLVDWNQACRGNPDVDLASWASSLRAEGGREPWELLPGQPCLAAWVAGFFAARAGLPPPETADPSVRALQLTQLEVALPWAVRELGLPPLDSR
jgi:Phosphotransferase enzyme family